MRPAVSKSGVPSGYSSCCFPPVGRTTARSFVGDQSAAIALYEQSILAANAAGDARTAADMHGNLASTWADLGQLDQAEAGLRQGLAEAERLELTYIRVWVLMNLGVVLTSIGRLDEARRAMTLAIEFGRKQGDRPRIVGRR